MPQTPLHDPYKLDRQKLQLAVHSGHFDTCLTLIKGLIDKTAVRTKTKNKDKRSSLSLSLSLSTTSSPGIDEEGIPQTVDTTAVPSLSSFDDLLSTPSSPSSPIPPSPNKTTTQHQHHHPPNPLPTPQKPIYNEAANITFGPLHDTLLLSLSLTGNLPLLTSLLRLGADPRKPNSKGLTPLMKAASKGFIEGVEVLIDYSYCYDDNDEGKDDGESEGGGGGEGYVFTKDNKGNTALDWARISSQHACAKRLEEVMDDEIRKKRDVMFGKVKHSELTALVRKNDVLYGLMMEYTMESNLKELMKIVDCSPFEREAYVAAVKALALSSTPHPPHESSSTPVPNSNSTSPSPPTPTPTHTPYFIDIETPNGFTPLMLACASNSLPSVLTLLSQSQSPTSTSLKTNENKRGHTALTWTCVCGHSAVLKALLEGGCGGEEGDRGSRMEGKTALIHAGFNGSDECVEVLVDFYYRCAVQRKFELLKNCDGDEDDGGKGGNGNGKKMSKKKKMSSHEEWDITRNWMAPFEKMILHVDIYGKTALQWAVHEGLTSTVLILQSAHDRLDKRKAELAREDALRASVPCRLKCGYVDRADRIEKHEIQRCPRRNVGCDNCGDNVPANLKAKHDEEECKKRVVKCAFKDRGCIEIMPFDDINVHVNHRCVYRKTTCRLCTQPLLYANRKEHETNICPLRTITCDSVLGNGCGEDMQATKLRRHLKLECKLRLVKCSVGCGLFLPANTLRYHTTEVCVQPCKWAGCTMGAIGPEDVRQLHESYLCPRRVVPCPNGCGVEGLIKCRISAHLRHMCREREVVGMFDLEPVRASLRAEYEDGERGVCGERMQRCRLNYKGRRISVRKAKTGVISTSGVTSGVTSPSPSTSTSINTLTSTSSKIKNKNKTESSSSEFETATIIHYNESTLTFKIQFTSGTRWLPLSSLDYTILDDNNWCCGWISPSTMTHHMTEQCEFRAVMCRLKCGQRVLDVGRYEHEAHQCPKRAVMCPLECGGRMNAEDAMVHTEVACVNREVLCVSCGMAMTLPKLEEHMRLTCPLATSRCPLGCGDDLKVSERHRHITERCDKRIITCTLCNDDNLFADELTSHVNGTLKDQECAMRDVTCASCQSTVQASHLPSHLLSHCPLRKHTCECGEVITYNTLSDHLILTCPAVLTYCNLGCGLKVRVMDMATHQSQSCSKRFMIAGKLSPCPLHCGTLVGVNERFLHVTSRCVKRRVECVNGCDVVVTEEERGEHGKVCRLRRVPCGVGSMVCARQVRSWFTTTTTTSSGGGTKSKSVVLVSCENHSSNAFIWAVDNGDTNLVTYFLAHTSPSSAALTFETPFGSTPLTIASHNADKAMLTLLINKAQTAGIALHEYVNYETRRGKTALTEAAKIDDSDTVKYLISQRADVDYVTKFYGKSAVDWARNMKCWKALDELVRARKVRKIVQGLFISVSNSDVEGVKRVVGKGEGYRLDHVACLERDIVGFKRELEECQVEVGRNEGQVDMLRPDLDHLLSKLKEEEERVEHIGITVAQLLKNAQTSAGRLQGGLSAAIVAVQKCGKAEVDEVYKVVKPTVECLMVVKGFCILKGIMPFVAANANANTNDSGNSNSNSSSVGRRRSSVVLTNTDSNAIKNLELMGYWKAAEKSLKAKNLAHQLRYFVKARCPAGAVERVARDVFEGGWLEYGGKYGLFVDVDAHDHAGGDADADGDENEGENEEKKEGGVEGGKGSEGEGFSIIAAIAKWVKAIVQYAQAAELQTDAKAAELNARSTFDSETTKLKHQRVAVEVAAFRLNLYIQELEQSKANERYTHRRISGGEAQLQVAKLFAIVTQSGHTLLSWACACGNVSLVDCFLERGAHPGLGDECNHLCARVLQSAYRRFFWRKTRHPWCLEVAREYKNREDAYSLDVSSLSVQVRKLRERVRMPLTEAFYNGHYRVAQSFKKKKMPVYHASLTMIMPCGATPLMGDPGGNQVLDKPMNIVECARLAKDRFQHAVYVDDNIGWEAAGGEFDPFKRGLEDATALWKHIHNVVEKGKSEMQKRRGARHERSLREEWGEKMDLAIASGDFAQMVVCAKAGALIDYQTSKGITPLMRAAMEDVHKVGHVWCVNDEGVEVTAVALLLDRVIKRPMIDFETDIGHTPLTFACYHARLEAVESLLNRGCGIDKLVRGGKTALIYAAMNGKAGVMNLLLERGASAGIKDEGGRNANDWAFERNFNECLAVLAKDRIGNKGLVKKGTGEANPRLPCEWACGRFMTAAKLRSHAPECSYRLVPCIYCDKDDLQSREKVAHEAEECKMRPTKCLMCAVPLFGHEVKEHVSELCLKRPVKCEQCRETLQFNKLKEHSMNICKKRRVPCPKDCGCEPIQFDQVMNHTRNTCGFRRVRCAKGCGGKMWAHQINEHEGRFCPENLIQCEYCHVEYKRRVMNEHYKKCPTAPLKCSNKHFGCDWVGPSKLLRKHLDFACDYTFNRDCPLKCGLKLRAVDVDEHVKKCPKRECLCETCGETITAAQVDIHAKYECVERKVPCGLCGEKVDFFDLKTHKDEFCEQRAEICSNIGCYMKLPVAKMTEHRQFSCRRATVNCRKGCGSTMYLEKRNMHEEEVCECRYVNCLMCGKEVRDRDKWDHQDKECVRRTV